MDWFLYDRDLRHERVNTNLDDYLSNRKQRVKVSNTLVHGEKYYDGIPPGSILGPLLFNIFLSDLFYFSEGTDIANYAGDTLQCYGNSRMCNRKSSTFIVVSF